MDISHCQVIASIRPLFKFNGWIRAQLNDLMVGDFVLVEYEGELFPGKIVKKMDDCATISCVQLSVACK